MIEEVIEEMIESSLCGDEGGVTSVNFVAPCVSF